MYKNETFALTTTAAAHTTKTLSFVYILEGGNGKRTDYYKINKRHTIKQYLLHINNKLRSIFSRVYCGKGRKQSVYSEIFRWIQVAWGWSRVAFWFDSLADYYIRPLIFIRQCLTFYCFIQNILGERVLHFIFSI